MSIDTIGLIEAFNLYALPPIVLAVVLGSRLHKPRPGVEGIHAPEADEDDSDFRARVDRLDRERVVRGIGTLSLALAARTLVMIIPEFQGYWLSGSFSSMGFLNVGIPLITVGMNLLTGLGLRRLRPWGRWVGVVWNGLASAVAWTLFVWVWRHGAEVPASEWPDIAASKVLPLLLALILLSRGSAQVVSARHRALMARTSRFSDYPARRSWLRSLLLGFLVAVVSTIVANGFDWAIRIRPELNEAMSTAP